MLGKDLGVDLGTASVLIFMKGKGVLLNEPSVMAIDRNTGRVIAVGERAKAMLGRESGSITITRPMRDGVICDYRMTERLLSGFMKQACRHMLLRPRVLLCIPSGVTEVEERAVVDAAIKAGASKAYLVEEPVAAALGAGLDLSEPFGNMVVDIGGGTTDVAVMSMEKVVVAASIKVAGNTFDEALRAFIRREYGLVIGDSMAEELKREVGCVIPGMMDRSRDVRGRCGATGLPRSVTVTSDETAEMLREPMEEILNTIHSVLEQTPPELIGDIMSRGITLTGGGSLLNGLDRRISEYTRVNAVVADDPVSCVAKGTGKILDNLDNIPSGVINVSKCRDWAI